MDHNSNINLGGNQMSLQDNQFSSNQNQFSSTTSNNGNSDDAFGDYGYDSMIGLVMGDLDLLNFITQNDQLEQEQQKQAQQQQQQQQPVQQNVYHIPQQQPQGQVGYQPISTQMPPQPTISTQQPVMATAGYNSCTMNMAPPTGPMNEVNLLDLHDEQSERIKSEVMGLNILENPNYRANNTGASTSYGPMPQPPQPPQQQQSTSGDQHDPNFDFLFPDKSSKEILECLINDETDMFDSLFAPRMDYASGNTTSSSTSSNGPMRSDSSQFGDLFRMNSNGTITPASPPHHMSARAPVPHKGKGKFFKGEPVPQGQNPRLSSRLGNKRILNAAKSDPLEQEPMQALMPSTSAPRPSVPQRMPPGKLEAYSDLSRHPPSAFKRKRSYEDEDGSDNSTEDYGQKQVPHFHSMENSMEMDAETQVLFDQSTHLLAALQRQSRLTGNTRLSSNMKEIEKQLQMLETIKGPGAMAIASKVVPNMSLEMRRSSINSADYAEENGPVKKESNKDAAFRYRLKKLSEKDRLFETRDHLEKENSEVRRRIELAQAEITYLKTLLVQMLLNKGYLETSRVVS